VLVVHPGGGPPGCELGGPRSVILGAGWARVPSWVRWGAVSGAVAALPLIGTMASLLQAGWSPSVDEATISWRAWDVLAGNGPLVGPFTSGSVDPHHPVFDLGPLLYWALAVPVHLAPQTGLLIGVTMLGVGSVIIACLAAAAVGGRLVAVTVGLGAVIVGWSLSAQFDDTLWNPYAALAPFGATLIVAWAVAAGRLCWWPCLVLLASFCAQSHLTYAAGSLLLVLVAPALGIHNTRRLRRVVGWRWVPAGALVATVCWSAPVWQQLTGSRGNLAAVWTATISRGEAGAGFQVGLRNLSRAVAPPRPVWLQPPYRHLAFPPESRSATWAIAALVALTVILGLGFWRNHRGVSSVAAVALLVDITTAGAIGGIPARSFSLSFSYIQYVLWPVGAMTWLALAYAGVALTGARVARFASRIRACRPVMGGTARALTLILVGLPLLVAAGFASQWQYRDAPSLGRTASGVIGLPIIGSGRARFSDAADKIAALLGSGPSNGNNRVAIATPTAGFGQGESLVMRTAYLLRLHGWTPAPVELSLSSQVAPAYSPRPGDPVLGVTAGSPPTGARLLGEVDYREGIPFTFSTRIVHRNVWLRPPKKPV